MQFGTNIINKEDAVKPRVKVRKLNMTPRELQQVRVVFPTAPLTELSSADRIIGWFKNNWLILAGAGGGFLLILVAWISIALLKLRRNREIKRWKEEGYRW